MNNLDNLQSFIVDYNAHGAGYVAGKLGIPRTVVGTGAALLKSLGFGVDTRTPASKKVKFDGATAISLFERGVAPKEIAAHLGVKAVSITAYLRRMGKIKKPVPLAEVLAAEAGSIAKAA